MPPLSYHLRNARSEDGDFLWQLKQQTMRRYVELTWGRWDAAEQKTWFLRNFRADDAQIIVVDGKDAGRLEVIRKPGEIFLGTIEILPEFQSRGIGSAVVTDLKAEAKSAGLALRLQVLKANPRAHELYRNLGFGATGETSTHHLMSWQAEKHCPAD